MRLKEASLCAAAAAATIIAAAGCTNVSDITVTRGSEGEGLREQIPPVTAYMFNEAANALALPTGAVGAGDYVAVYHLSAGKQDDQWWTYLAEDALVNKINAAGATAVERNDAAAALLATETGYYPPPRNGKGAAGVAPAANPKERPTTPYRATRVLCYRVVAAKLYITPPSRELNRVAIHKEAMAAGPAGAALAAVTTSPGETPARAAHATAQIILNLRTLDASTGEVLWAGTVTASAERDVPITWLEPADFWRGPGGPDWDDDDAWDWCFRWSEEPCNEEVYIGPAH